MHAAYRPHAAVPRNWEPAATDMLACYARAVEGTHAAGRSVADQLRVLARAYNAVRGTGGEQMAAHVCDAICSLSLIHI